MAILSIIACRMLEDELVYVLSRDTDLHELILVENRENLGLSGKLRTEGCIPRQFPLDRISKILEDEKNQLLSEILKPFCTFHFIKEMSGFSDGILIFYGTCGHSLKNLENEFKDSKCTFYFLKDNMRETVEDCISVVLGGNDAYATTLMNNKGVGTIFLTPMWASGWKEIFYENCFSSSAFAKNDLKRYGRVAKIKI